MKRLMIFITAFLLGHQVSSQSHIKLQIIGHIIDEESKDPLLGATILCLDESDSTKTSITFTDKNGYFIFDSIPVKKVILHITYIGYQPLTFPIHNSVSSSLIDLGIVRMNRFSLRLSQIEISETRKKIRIAKDTLEYYASTFNTKYNATIEDLLKKIPGIQIDNDGSIRLNGEIIERITINSRPLLEMNNKIITRNLQADLIEKIQLINRGSQQRSSDRYNGEQSDKIINITIREDKKKTVSGELSAAYGTSNRYSARFNLSNFKDQQQFFITGNGDNMSGSSNSRTQEYSDGRVNYSNNINRKSIISIGYTANKINTLSENISTKENIGEDSDVIYNQQNNNQLRIINNSLSLQFDYRIDSLQTLTISNQTTASTSKNLISNKYETTLNHSQHINNIYSFNDNKNTSFSTNNSFRYEKKFLRAGRSLDINISLSSGNINTLMYIKSNNIYSLNGEYIRDSVNQNMTKKENLRQVYIMASFTEPIIKDGTLTLSMAKGILKTSSARSTYYYNDSTDKYDIRNDSLSNYLNNSPKQYYARLTWFHKKENLNYSISLATLKYMLVYKDDKVSLNRRFITILPDANLNIILSVGQQFQASFRKTSAFPDNTQLQINSDNTDPLYLKRGNPDLKPMDNHNLRFIYTKISNSNLNNLSITLDAKILSNKITDATWFDTLGRQISEPINLSGNYSINTYVESSISLKDAPNRIFLSSSASIVKLMNSTNGAVGFNRNINASQSIKILYEYKRLLEIILGANIGFSNLVYMNKKITRSNFSNIGTSVSGTLNLSHNFSVNTDFDVKWLTGRTAEYSSVPFLLNLSISKLLFPHKQGIVQIQCYDLLKQNTNIIRTIGPNYVEDTKSNVLQRYILLKFSYHLGKK